MKTGLYVVLSGILGLFIFVGVVMILMSLTACSFNQIQTDTHGQSYDTVRESSHAALDANIDPNIKPIVPDVKPIDPEFKIFVL